jgi:nicotinamide riboside transporter PnuC
MISIEKIFKSNFHYLLPIFLGISFLSKSFEIKLVCLILILLISITGIYKWVKFGMEVKGEKEAHPKAKSFMLILIMSILVILMLAIYVVYQSWCENLI